MSSITPQSLRAREDRALFFPPVREIRLIFALFWPLAGSAFFAFLSYFLGLEEISTALTVIAIGLFLVTWIAFIRILTARSELPANIPDHYADGSLPLRFQPEIGWQAMKLVARTLIMLVGVAIVAGLLIGIFEGWDDLLTGWQGIGPFMLGGAAASTLITVPVNALVFSKYGLVEWAQRDRDGGLPKALIERRNLAAKALIEAYPGISPLEADPLPRKA
ncbi:hypothetical protein [Maricaulis sp.]|uniref:hypothetical protein n=1 Tax=Maricaulis sp. TaxID=1486257 RepID=UPI0026057B39|nr:hypothetical protein [Maricaulis sp.]